MSSQSIEFFTSEFAGHQIPTAYLHNLFVLRDCIWYLHLHALDRSDLEQIYKSFRESVMNSQAIIGPKKEIRGCLRCKR